MVDKNNGIAIVCSQDQLDSSIHIYCLALIGGTAYHILGVQPQHDFFNEDIGWQANFANLTICIDSKGLTITTNSEKLCIDIDNLKSLWLEAQHGLENL